MLIGLFGSVIAALGLVGLVGLLFTGGPTAVVTIAVLGLVCHRAWRDVRRAG